MKPLTVAAVACFLGFAVFSLTLKRELRGNGVTQKLIDQGQIIPNFQAQDLNGNQIDGHELAKSHRALVITFWATWCDPCVSELDNLQKVYPADHNAGAEFVTVVLDPTVAPDFLQHHPLAFPVLLDPQQEIAKSFGVRSLPSTVVVTPNLVVLSSSGGANATNTHRQLMFFLSRRRQ